MQAVSGAGRQSLGSRATLMAPTSYCLPSLFGMTVFGLNSAVENEDWNKTVTESKDVE